MFHLVLWVDNVSAESCHLGYAVDICRILWGCPESKCFHYKMKTHCWTESAKFLLQRWKQGNALYWSHNSVFCLLFKIFFSCRYFHSLLPDSLKKKKKIEQTKTIKTLVLSLACDIAVTANFIFLYQYLFFFFLKIVISSSKLYKLCN